MSKSAQKYQPQAASNTMTYALVGIGIVVVAILVIVGFVWNRNKSYDPVDQQVLATNSTFVVGAAAAPVTIDVFEDFRCPHCLTLEQTSGPAIEQAVGAGKLRVRYHMLNFLDGESSSGDFSSRAAGAMVCLAQSTPDDASLLKLHREIFAKGDGADGGSDLDNQRLAELAAQAGGNAAVQKCVRDGGQVDQGRELADVSTTQLENALEGPAGTPSILHNGAAVGGITDGTEWLTTLLSAK